MKYFIIPIVLLVSACANKNIGEPKCAIHVGSEWNQVECSTIDLRIKADHLINGPLDD